MSMDRCAHCGEFVDMDSDPQCYIQELPDGTEIELDSCRCENCRDDYYNLIEQ